MNWEYVETMPHTKYYGPTLRISHYTTPNDYICCLQILTKEGWSILHSIKLTVSVNQNDAEIRLKAYAHKIYAG